MPRLPLLFLILTNCYQTHSKLQSYNCRCAGLWLLLSTTVTGEELWLDQCSNPGPWSYHQQLFTLPGYILPLNSLLSIGTLVQHASEWWVPSSCLACPLRETVAACFSLSPQFQTPLWGLPLSHFTFRLNKDSSISMTPQKNLRLHVPLVVLFTYFPHEATPIHHHTTIANSGELCILTQTPIIQKVHHKHKHIPYV